MNYKIIMIALLLPAVSYSAENIKKRNARIEELEILKGRTEYNAVQLGSQILKEQNNLIQHKERVFSSLSSEDYRRKEGKDVMTRKQFYEFISQLSSAFDKGEDIKPLVENRAFYCEKTNAGLHLTYVSLVIQQLFVDRMVDQYSKVSEGLRTINKELHSLKAQ